MVNVNKKMMIAFSLLALFSVAHSMEMPSRKRSYPEKKQEESNKTAIIDSLNTLKTSLLSKKDQETIEHVLQLLNADFSSDMLTFAQDELNKVKNSKINYFGETSTAQVLVEDLHNIIVKEIAQISDAKQQDKCEDKRPRHDEQSQSNKTAIIKSLRGIVRACLSLDAKTKDLITKMVVLLDQDFSLDTLAKAYDALEVVKKQYKLIELVLMEDAQKLILQEQERLSPVKQDQQDDQALSQRFVTEFLNEIQECVNILEARLQPKALKETRKIHTDTEQAVILKGYLRKTHELIAKLDGDASRNAIIDRYIQEYQGGRENLPITFAKHVVEALEKAQPQIKILQQELGFMIERIEKQLRFYC